MDSLWRRGSRQIIRSTMVKGGVAGKPLQRVGVLNSWDVSHGQVERVPRETIGLRHLSVRLAYYFRMSWIRPVGSSGLGRRR